MTEVKLAMNYIAPNLLPQEQKSARKISRNMLNNLLKIDRATKVGNSLLALNSYSAVYADIDKFLKLLVKIQPQSISQS